MCLQVTNVFAVLCVNMVTASIILSVLFVSGELLFGRFYFTLLWSRKSSAELLLQKKKKTC